MGKDSPVVPRAGTWIETTFFRLLIIVPVSSFPVRERGLKLQLVSTQMLEDPSFPVRERGLKLTRMQTVGKVQYVVPRAGTWIETRPASSEPGGHLRSFPVRERGLKPTVWSDYEKWRGRSPCGNVD